jgi:outer membrane protein assembly factor BamB
MLLIAQIHKDLIHFSVDSIRYLKIATVVGLLLLTVGCLKEEHLKMDEVLNDDGTIIRKAELWQTSLSDVGLLIGTFMSPLVYEDIVTVAGIGSSDKDWYLTGLNVKTGEEIWRWKDFLTPHFWYGEAFQSDFVMIKEEGDFNTRLGSAFYGIDLRSGSSIWKEFRGKPFGNSTPIMNNFYYFALFNKNENSYDPIPVIYRGDIKTNQYDSITIPSIDSIKLSFNNEFGLVNPLFPFTSENDHEYLLIQYTEFQIEEGPSYLWTWGNVYAGLYDLTISNYVYNKALITSNSNSQGGPILYNDKVFVTNSNYEMIGVDLYSGKVIWRNYYDQGVFSYLIVDSILVIAQVIGAETYAYGLDPMTGNQLWRIPSGGGASEMQALNGVVYWKDRGDGKLYAVEATTGKLLWKLNDPDPESNSWWKSDGVAVMAGKNGEKGRVFASTHLRMYCFEAAR